jgi:hypothetical protein
MDLNCNFLVKLLDNKEEILFCELVLEERKADKNRYYRNIVEACRNSTCEKRNHEQCRYYCYKIGRLDELEA